MWTIGESRRRLGKCFFPSFLLLAEIKWRLIVGNGRWNEAELRTYVFGDGEDETAMIYETEGSLQARGGLLEDGGDRFLQLNQPAMRGKPPN